MSIICLNSAAYLHYKHSDTVMGTGDWSDYDKLGWVPLGWFYLGSMIQNHSDHVPSKESQVFSGSFYAK